MSAELASRFLAGESLADLRGGLRAGDVEQALRDGLVELRARPVVEDDRATRCPACGHEVEFPAPVAGVTTCPACTRSLVLDGDVARPAVKGDIDGLSEAELAQLRAARNRPKRARLRA